MQKRRTFIKSISAIAAASLILPKQLLAKKNEKPIGIQLYTLRDLIKEDFEGTLETISNIGYQVVEAAGYENRKFYGFYPGEYKKIIENYGLVSISSHAKFTLFDAPEVIEDTLESGAKYLVIPWLAVEDRKTTDDYKRLAEEFNKIGELCNRAGLTFGYHNHDFEFKEIDGMIPYNILLENTEDELVTMELDLYWIVRGGFNPQEYFELFPGRFKLWHIKDMDTNVEMDFAPVGKGLINFQSIFRQQQKAGLEFSFVEQDSHSNDDPILNIKSSYNYLNMLTEY